MTLASMADFVCRKVGQTDEDSVAICKAFLRNRYRMIYDAELWRESLVLGTVAFAAGKESLALPEAFERVLKVRTSSSSGFTTLPVQDQITLFDFDPEIFDRSGPLRGFSVLTPVATIEVLSGANIIYAQDTNANDNEKVVTAFGEDANGDQVSAELVLNGSLTSPTTTAFRFIYSIGKPLTEGVVTVFSHDDTVLARMQPGETEAKRFCRIRLYDDPASGDTLTILGKRRIKELFDDNDAPIIRNVENALLAYAQSDMLERQRQYGKARLKIDEAAAQMAILRDLEKNQTANVVRIIPQMEPDPLQTSGFTSKSHW